MISRHVSTIKLSPQKLARIIAECACQELGGSSSGGYNAQPASKNIGDLPSQGSVDAGLFPGMGDTPALSDSSSSGSCTSSPEDRDPVGADTTSAELPIDNVEQLNTMSATDDPETVELVIGSI